MSSTAFRRRAAAAAALGLCLVAPLLRPGPPVFADITVVDQSRPLDPNRVTVAARQAAVGKDVTALFAYVRDAIRYEPYAGVLRGARGTLISEAGNSVDKALLLHELLRAAGRTSRFAHGKLSAADGGRLRAAAFRWPARQEAPPPPDARVKAFLDNLQKETDERYRETVKALLDGGFVLPQSQPADAGAQRDVDDHFWVQVQDGAAWTDLDPSFPDAVAGRAYATPATTLAAVPEPLFHLVTIRVIVEEPAGTSRRTRPVLTYVSRAADLSGKSVVLSHAPGDWEKTKPMPALAAAVGGAFAAAAGAGSVDSAKPVLVIDSEFRAGEAFPVKNPANEAGGGGGGLAGLGALLGGGTDNQPQASAEWIEVEFRSPDGTADTARRTVFDRIGFAARQAGGGTPATAPLGIEHPLRSLFCLSFYTGPLVSRSIFSAGDTGNRNTLAGPRSGTLVEVSAVLEGVNHLISLISDARVTPVISAGEEVIYVHSSPRLIVSTFQSTDTRGKFSVDLRRARYRPLTKTLDGARNAFLFELYRGVADGVLEELGTDALLEPAKPGGSLDTSWSANAAFRDAARRGTRVVLLKKGAAPGLSGDAGARLTKDLSDGYLVLRPERPAGNAATQAAWWRIDPATGYALGVTGDGLHGQDEYLNVVRLVSGRIIVYGQIGARIIAPRAVSAPVAGAIINAVLRLGRGITINITIFR